MTTCKHCGEPISSTAKTCPHCGGKNKKPLYKRPWIYILALLIVFFLVGGSGNSSTNNDTASKNDSSAEVLENDNIPNEYKSALRSAKTYSDTMHMSKQAIYNQLTSDFDKFSEDAAQYAVDNLDADYNKNALKKAESYSNTMSMSKRSIYNQLTSDAGEKFTAEEAQYAIDHLDD